MLANILSGDLDALDMMSHMSVILRDEEDKSSKRSSTKSKGDDEQIKINSLSYAEAKAISEREEENSIPLSKSKSLVDAVNSLMLRAIAQKEEARFGMEEGGETADGEYYHNSNPVLNESISFSSKKMEFTSAQKKVTGFLESYCQYLETFFDRYEYGRVTQMPHVMKIADAAFFQVVMIQLVLALKKPYSYQKKQYAEKNTGKRYLLDLKSNLCNDASFQGWAYCIIGIFCHLVHKHKWKEYSDEYSKKELEKYQQEIAAWAYLIILISADDKDVVGFKTSALVWLNVEKTLGIYDAENFFKLKEKVASIVDLKMPENFQKSISLFTEGSKRIHKVAVKAHPNKFIFIKGFGYASIARSLPEVKKIDYPGIHSVICGDSLYPEYYDIVDEQFKYGVKFK